MSVTPTLDVVVDEIGECFNNLLVSKLRLCVSPQAHIVWGSPLTVCMILNTYPGEHLKNLPVMITFSGL